ncbi:YdiU family protein [Natronospirillum operosum]|uniref:Protein nucleotidyltransferase YdiU n=1 Tax=Natronospirillum operosum TaxID=2759953 RepID=A0A4Z0WBP8_9GAMM|nr:YdiU family protein [Natronospirillum operosum]TGG93343.1 YdiU family protein [Natronospirillum operosum]
MLELPFDNSYARLPERFYQRQAPQPVQHPELIILNRELATQLGLRGCMDSTDADLAHVFAGNELIPGAEPLAQAYAGHQFGQFVPQLGDGRALLLGEVVDARGQRRDIQLKGSGRTAFSRGGDGRAPLGPVLREYLVSEAMHALGVPTTRALAAVTSGESVLRDRGLPGAVLTRVAASHIRVGTFQYFAAREDRAALRELTRYTLDRHADSPVPADHPSPGMALLELVADRQARLVARWMGLGFIHGVMNTDNTALSGETIDFGPCAFMESYRPETVFSSIDQGGRYAYRNQPAIAQWNLARLAEALLVADDDPETHLEDAREIIGQFTARYDMHRLAVLRRKLGLQTDRPEDAALIDDWLHLMAQAEADFTLSFRRLGNLLTASEALQGMDFDATALKTWRERWLQRLAAEGTTTETARQCIEHTSPAVIPRNHLVEAAIRAAEDQQDLQPFHDLLAEVTQPWTTRAEDARHVQPAAPDERVYQTFCGT